MDVFIEYIVKKKKKETLWSAGCHQKEMIILIKFSVFLNSENSAFKRRNFFD